MQAMNKAMYWQIESSGSRRDFLNSSHEQSCQKQVLLDQAAGCAVMLFVSSTR